MKRVCLNGSIMLVFIVITLIILSCSKNNEDYFCEIAVFPKNRINDSYYYILYKDGTLEGMRGKRESDDINTKPFLVEIDQYEVIQLTKDEMKNLLDMLKEIDESGWDEPLYQQYIGGNITTMKFKGKVYFVNIKSHFHPEVIAPEVFYDFVNEIGRLSPIYKR